jgi:hypothetical protein
LIAPSCISRPELVGDHPHLRDAAVDHGEDVDGLRVECPPRRRDGPERRGQRPDVAALLPEDDHQLARRIDTAQDLIDPDPFERCMQHPRPRYERLHRGLDTVEQERICIDAGERSDCAVTFGRRPVPELE